MADENPETNPAVDNAVASVNNTKSALDFDDPARELKPSADEQVPAKAQDPGEGADTAADGEPVEFPPKLMARAKSLGLSIAEVKELGTPESVTNVLDELEARAEATNAEPSTRRTPETPAKPERRKLKVDPAVVGEETAALLNQLDQEHAAEIEALQKALADRDARIEAHFGAAKEQRIEAYFDALQDFQDVVGPEHSRNRRKVIDAMDMLQDGYEAKGRKLPPESELFRKAFALEFGDRQAAVARKKIGEQLDKRKAQTIARPDQRTANMSPTQRAVATVANYMREHDTQDAPDISELSPASK